MWCPLLQFVVGGQGVLEIVDVVDVVEVHDFHQDGVGLLRGDAVLDVGRNGVAIWIVGHGVCPGVDGSRFWLVSVTQDPTRLQGWVGIALIRWVERRLDRKDFTGRSRMDRKERRRRRTASASLTGAVENYLSIISSILDDRLPRMIDADPDSASIWDPWDVGPVLQTEFSGPRGSDYAEIQLRIDWSGNPQIEAYAYLLGPNGERVDILDHAVVGDADDTPTEISRSILQAFKQNLKRSSRTANREVVKVEKTVSSGDLGDWLFYDYVPEDDDVRREMEREFAEEYASELREAYARKWPNAEIDVDVEHGVTGRRTTPRVYVESDPGEPYEMEPTLSDKLVQEADDLEGEVLEVMNRTSDVLDRLDDLKRSFRGCRRCGRNRLSARPKRAMSPRDLEGERIGGFEVSYTNNTLLDFEDHAAVLDFSSVDSEDFDMDEVERIWDELDTALVDAIRAENIGGVSAEYNSTDNGNIVYMLGYSDAWKVWPSIFFERQPNLNDADVDDMSKGLRKLVNRLNDAVEAAHRRLYDAHLGTGDPKVDFYPIRS